MKTIVLTLMMIITVLGAKAQQAFEDLIFSAALDTLQNVGTLSVPAYARGAAGFTYHDDTLWFDITVNGLSGPIIGSHIHSGYSGTNGNVVYDLTPFVDGNKIKGFLSGISLKDGELELFFEGGYYVNVHTAANPAGEVRGQIWPETDRNYAATLDLMQAGNPGTSGSGLASLNLGQDKSELEINMLVTGLTGAITNAHLHYGLPGQSGPVVIPLMSFNQGSTFQGVYDLSQLADPAAFLDSLNQGKVYVNVHTAAYPAGEIRGQVSMSRPLSFDTWMVSSEEPNGVDPSTPAAALGLCTFTVNSRSDSMWVSVQADQLSGGVSGAHFHFGQQEENGPVVVDLTGFLEGTVIQATLTPSSPEFVGELDFGDFVKRALSGKIYVNIHTALNPGGEVRGQASKLMREGVVFSLCAAQETDPVAGGDNAQGSGFVTLDRGFSNLHYGIAATSLSSTVIGAHFHHAMAGTNGPVIFALPTDTAMSGFWNDAAFTGDVADWFESGEVYANLHTINNPAGEIRGQVDEGEWCDAVTGIADRVRRGSASVNIYPNPAGEQATISFTLTANGETMIQVFNILGAEVAAMKRGYLTKGTYQNTLNVSALNDGVYFYSVVIDGTPSATGRLIVAR